MHDFHPHQRVYDLFHSNKSLPTFLDIRDNDATIEEEVYGDDTSQAYMHDHLLSLTTSVVHICLSYSSNKILKMIPRMLYLLRWIHIIIIIHTHMSTGTFYLTIEWSVHISSGGFHLEECTCSEAPLQSCNSSAIITYKFWQFSYSSMVEVVIVNRCNSTFYCTNIVSSYKNNCQYETDSWQIHFHLSILPVWLFCNIFVIIRSTIHIYKSK